MDFIVRELVDGSADKHYQYHEIDTLGELFGGDSVSKRDIVFVTGNKRKVGELMENLKMNSITLTVQNLDLPEIQDDNMLNIVQDKCQRAYEQVNKDLAPENRRPILIEDTCLHFKALNGMPGPYIKWFLKAVGTVGLTKMLAAYDDKTAEAVCTYAYMNNDKRIIFCKGSVRGRITEPRGESWGWDPVFEEERCGLTFGEMEPSMKFKFSHRANAITVLKKFLSIL